MKKNDAISENTFDSLPFSQVMKNFNLKLLLKKEKKYFAYLCEVNFVLRYLSYSLNLAMELES